MQRLILAVLAASFGLAGAAHAQRPQALRPPSRWLISGHSTAALGTSVGDAFGSINTSTGLGAGVEVGYLITPRLVAYAGLDIVKQPVDEVGSKVTSASRISRPAPDSASRSLAAR